MEAKQVDIICILDTYIATAQLQGLVFNHRKHFSQSPFAPRQNLTFASIGGKDT